MSDYAAFRVGGSTQPLSTTSSDSLLLDADPTLFYALDFWAYCINTYPGPRLLKAAANGVAPIQNAIEQTIPFLPEPEHLTQTQFRFPSLFMGRTSVKYQWKRVGWDSDRCSFDLLYVLPPLTAGQCEQVLPYLRAVEEVVTRKTVESYDAGYTPPGGSAGQSPWGQSFASVEEIGFETGNRGAMPDLGNLYFPTLRMQGFVVERNMYVPAANKFAGGDITLNLAAPDGTQVAPFIQASTQQPPTVTSLSVTAGGIAGGTSTTLTGTLFLTGPQVFFGGTPATNVVWNSATSITCSTPAVSGAGTLGVTVLNRDGQAGSKANAFTFS